MQRGPWGPLVLPPSAPSGVTSPIGHQNGPARKQLTWQLEEEAMVQEQSGPQVNDHCVVPCPRVSQLAVGKRDEPTYGQALSHLGVYAPNPTTLGSVGLDNYGSTATQDLSTSPSNFKQQLLTDIGSSYRKASRHKKSSYNQRWRCGNSVADPFLPPPDPVFSLSFSHRRVF